MAACKLPMKLFSYISLHLLNAFHRSSSLPQNKRCSFLPLWRGHSGKNNSFPPTNIQDTTTNTFSRRWAQSTNDRSGTRRTEKSRDTLSKAKVAGSPAHWPVLFGNRITQQIHTMGGISNNLLWCISGHIETVSNFKNRFPCFCDITWFLRLRAMNGRRDQDKLIKPKKRVCKVNNKSWTCHRSRKYFLILN